MSTRIVVLGGGGFLGGHVARALAEGGHRVRVLDLRLPTPTITEKSGLIEYVEGNFLNPSDVDRALEDGADAVLHFVSTTVPASSIGNVQVEIETNVAATVRLLDAMARRGIRRLGFPSSGGTIYGEATEPHREDERPRPTCPYGLGKLLIERILDFYREHHGIDHQIWRIANPYGDVAKTHMTQGAIDAFLHRIRAGETIQIWGDGGAVRDFIFADDVANAIRLLIEREAWNETVNIGTGQGSSIAEVVETIRTVIDRTVRVTRLDGYTGPARSVLDPGRLRRLTGWTPAFDLPSGIREAWRRMRP